MYSRRSFIRKTSAAGIGAFGTASLFNQLHAKEFTKAEDVWNDLPPGNDTGNEDYWSMIQQAYTVNQILLI